MILTAVRGAEMPRVSVWKDYPAFGPGFLGVMQSENADFNR